MSSCDRLGHSFIGRSGIPHLVRTMAPELIVQRTKSLLIFQWQNLYHSVCVAIITHGIGSCLTRSLSRWGNNAYKMNVYRIFVLGTMFNSLLPGLTQFFST